MARVSACFEVDRRDLGLTRMVETGGFARDAASWLTVVRRSGLGAVDEVYQAVLNNTVSSPAEAQLIDLTDSSRR